MADQPRVIRPKTAAVRAAASQQLAGKTTVQTEHRIRKETINETTKQETHEAGYFPPGVEPALVRVSAGSTINLGNFESMRIDVSVTLPCRVEDIDDTYLQASEFVSEKMAEEEEVWMGPANRLPAKPAPKAAPRR